MVANFFKGTECKMDFGTNPDEDIALGAAYLAFLKTNPSMAQIRYKGLKSKDDHSDEELKIN